MCGLHHTPGDAKKKDTDFPNLIISPNFDRFDRHFSLSANGHISALDSLGLLQLDPRRQL